MKGLTTDHARRLEFITTTHFLDTYLKGNSQILDLGAGSGYMHPGMSEGS
ncbi:hypothetical protein [Paenibacillus sonchi]|nr:hypothetical protein [Paenibacillus sonchi]